jgi:serine/threonine protein kinase
VDQQGYIRLSNLGMARFLSADNAADFNGTPAYMAPEVLNAANHDYRADYFSLGVICHEMITGKQPYHGANKKEVRADVQSRQEYIKTKPRGISAHAIDFTNRCLLRKPEQRLGLTGVIELKHHPWFDDFDWVALKESTMKSPVKPLPLDKIDDNFSGISFDIGNKDRQL